MRIYRLSQVENISDQKYYDQFKVFLNNNLIEWKQVPGHWVSRDKEGPGFYGTFLGFVSLRGKPSKIYSYKVIIELSGANKNEQSETIYDKAFVSLLVNKLRSRIGEGEDAIATWNFQGDKSIKEDMPSFLKSAVGIDNVTLPHDNLNDLTGDEIKVDIPERIRLTRLKDSRLGMPPSSVEINISSRKISGYVISFTSTNNLEIGGSTQKRLTGDSKQLTAKDVLHILEDILERLKNSGYVDKNSPMYYPEGATAENYDFDKHKWRVPLDAIPSKIQSQPIIPEESVVPEEEREEELDEDEDMEPPIRLKDLLSRRVYQNKIAQNFEGYFSGEVPDYAVDMLGTGSVDASQLKALFGRVDDAIRLVNQFDSSLLENVSFIFNFSKSGAYGVYLLELDRAIKTKALQKELEKKGYVIVHRENGLEAYVSKGGESKTQQEMQKEIDTIYNRLEAKGGTAFGINMSKVLAAANDEMAKSESQDPNLWEWFAILHLGETIVHEAMHAKGYKGEGEPHNRGIEFVNKMLPIINEQYKNSLMSQGKEELYVPIQFTGSMVHAYNKSWYKMAKEDQEDYYNVETASNPNTPPEILTEILKRGNNDWVSEFAVKNLNTPPETLTEILRRGNNDYVSMHAAKNPNTPPETLTEILKRGNDDGVSMSAAENPNCPPEILAEILRRGNNDDVSRYAAFNPNTPPEILTEILRRGNNDLVSQYAVKNPNAPPQAQELWEEAKEDQERFGDPIKLEDFEKYLTNKSWYKMAQQLPYFFPYTHSNFPKGSDLSGRFPIELMVDKGRAGWGMIMQEDQNEPIEKRLGRQYMSPLPQGLDQNNDSIEEQLRKYRIEDVKLDPKASTEELLSQDHDEASSYYTLEALLDEERPKPLMLPLKKTASVKKIATLFGWMNNLEISDGKTIPGLGDRVMAWDDRDESFVANEEWIREQPRYNPTYDDKGFYYRYIEPRFHPSLWNDINPSGVHPSRRFAEKITIDPDLARILSIFSVVKSKVRRKDIRSTRLIMSDDILPLVDKVFSDFKIDVFDTGHLKGDEKIYSVWISDADVDTNDIEKAERYFQDKEDVEDANDLLEKLFGLCQQRSGFIQKIKEELNVIAEDYGFKGFIFRDNDIAILPNDIILFKLQGLTNDQLAKVSSLLSKKLCAHGVDIDKKSKLIFFDYKGHTIVLKSK